MYLLIYLKICQELIYYMGRGDVPPALTVFSDSLGVIYGLSVVQCLSSSSARVGFPDSSVSKESTCNAGDPGSIPGSGRSAGERKGYPLQYSWASLVAQLVKNPPAMRETWVGKTPWRKERILTPVFWPKEFHGPYNPWGHKELDTTGQLSLPPSARVSATRTQDPRKAKACLESRTLGGALRDWDLVFS